MSDTETIRIYDARAADYAEMTDDQNRADPMLTEFIALCPSGGQTLDLGCGPGASAAAMARAGLIVEAIDASSEMVAMAALLPGVTARQGTFDDITAQGTYDGIWASFSLLHAPRADFPRHLRALHRALKPAGVFYIGMKLGTGAARDRIGRHYTYYTDQELEVHMTKAGFIIDDKTFGSGKGLDGSPSDFVAVIAHA